jgi:ribosomal protein L17
MLANMACSLIEHKRINTTVAKAKALKQFVEPLITKSKEDTTHNRRSYDSNGRESQYREYNNRSQQNKYENHRSEKNSTKSEMDIVPSKTKDKLLKLHVMANRGSENERVVAAKKIGNIVNGYKVSKKAYNEWAKEEIKKSEKR